MLSPIQVLCSDITTLSLEPEPFASYTEGVCSILFYPEGQIRFARTRHMTPARGWWCVNRCVCEEHEVNSHVSLDVLNIITLSPSVSLICYYYASIFITLSLLAAACVKIPLNSLT